MTIRKIKNRRGKFRYYFQFMVDGRYYRGGGYDSKTDALNAEGKARTFLVSPEKILFLDAAKEYFQYCKETLQQTEQWISDKERIVNKYFKDYWSGWPISKITPNMVEQVVKDRKSNRDLKLLKPIFNFAIRKGWATKNPATGIHFKETHRERYVPPIEDFKKVLNVAKQFDKQLLTVLFCTAARINEVLSLRWADVDENYVHLKSRKHRYGEERTRKISLSPLLKESLDWLRERKHDEWIFSNPKMNSRYLRRPKMMRGLCRQAGVKAFGFHGVRHLAASLLSGQNIPIKEVSEYLGHATVSTTEQYLHSLEEGMQAAARQFSAE